MRLPRLTGGDPSRLRRLNSLMTIQALRGQDNCTITDLVNVTGLSRPATEDVVHDLVNQGWVDELEPSGVSMGRPARRYRFRASARHVLGLDVGAHAVRGMIADLDGEPLSSATLDVRPDTPAKQRLAVIGDVIDACARDAGLATGQLSAVAAATTGLVDDRGHVTLATGIPDWAGINLAGWLGEQVPCAVFAENDTKLAALAEQWRGAAHGAQDVVYVLAGRRTAASLIVGGQVHRGNSGMAGEIGMLPESRWAAAQDHLSRFPAVDDENSPEEHVRHVFDMARDGNPAARLAVRGYAADLAVGIAALVLTLDPELVVIGGGYSRAGDVVLTPLRDELERRCLYTPTVVPSKLGGEAPLLGAVRRALDAAEAEAFAPDAPQDPPE